MVAREGTLDKVGALGKWAQTQSCAVVVAGMAALPGPPLILSTGADCFSLTLA